MTMSIAKRVMDTIDKLIAGDREGALFQICSAIDATAQAQYGKEGGAQYRRFIHENLELITSVRGVRRTNFHFEYDLNAHRGKRPPIPAQPDGTFSIQDILYYVVRCGLYHS